MNVTREVILDLLPLYLSGEASPATASLVEEYLRQDPELAQRVLVQKEQRWAAVVPPTPPPEMELRALRRARRLLGWQHWLFGLGITFTALAVGIEISFEGGRLKELHFLLRDYPAQCGVSLVFGLACWTTYLLVRRHIRTRIL